MLPDPSEFAFTRGPRTEPGVFRAEFDRLGRDDVPLWPDRAAYGGDWRVAPLFMPSHRPGIEEQFAQHQAKCPRSTACLRAIPGVTAAAFSWMEPGCHIYAHRDVKAIEVLRAHLPLEAPVGARMRVATDVHTWREGQCLLFDGYIDHETGNEAPMRRVVLLVDARLEGEEFERLQAWRRDHRVDIDPQLVLRHAYTRDTMG
jgi:ornithine lipid ester-linked acyl 2-hydroxylase